MAASLSSVAASVSVVSAAAAASPQSSAAHSLPASPSGASSDTVVEGAVASMETGPGPALCPLEMDMSERRRMDGRESFMVQAGWGGGLGEMMIWK